MCLPWPTADAPTPRPIRLLRRARFDVRVGQPQLSPFVFDLNQDGELDISDGLKLLGMHFLGEAAPDCGDGQLQNRPNTRLLDINGDATVDLSDVVSIFSFLFLGGPPPVLGRDCVIIPDCPDVCP